MDVARINFSHGTHEIFTRIIDDLRNIEAELGRPIGIMGDIQGPKFRVGKIAGGAIELKAGAEVWITSEAVVGGQKDSHIVLSTPYRDFVKDVPVGSSILLDDGLMALLAVEKAPPYLKCRVESGGILKDNKGINVPEAAFSVKSITEKDYEDILFCLDKKVDFIALSFVRSSQEIRHLKRFIETRGQRIAVLAKIEKRDAITNLEDIIDASDGVLVARGDLAVEVGNERVPVLQKRIVRKSNLRGKTVIIATQMLMSMVENPRPTRAEASDVANAIVDGTDALMLSNETTVGKYPIESVRMMAKIITEMESDILGQGSSILYNEWELPPQGQLAIALLQSAARLAAVLKAQAIVVVSQSGISAMLVSKCRPKNRVIAITGSQDTYRQLSLKWGVRGIYMEDMESLISQTAVFEAVGQRLLAFGLCNTGDRVVITAGLPRLAHGSTNTIKVHQI